MRPTPKDPPEPKPASFGKLLRNHRQERQISLADMARAVAMDTGLLSKIERGLRPPPEVVPYVQQILRVFGVDPSSETARELTESATRERLGKTRKGRGEIITVGLPEGFSGGPPPRGLGGLPPELIPPDSPAGRYYRSRGIPVGQDWGGKLDTHDPSEAPRPPSPAVSRQLAVQRWAFEVASALGLALLRFEQVGDRWEVEFQTLDGKEYELVCGPKKPRSKTRKRPQKGSSSQRRRS